MFACCCEVDLLCGNEPNVSSDDWGTCGSAIGKIGLGCVCHSLLPTSFREALPDWTAMKPAAETNDNEDDVQAERLVVQKKSWRTFKVLESRESQFDLILMAWTTAPVERLMSELAWLDRGERGLWDSACFLDQLNPIFNCKTALAALVHGGERVDKDPFWALIEVFPHRRRIFDTADKQVSDFSAQLEFRFDYYQRLQNQSGHCTIIPLLLQMTDNAWSRSFAASRIVAGRLGLARSSTNTLAVTSRCFLPANTSQIWSGYMFPHLSTRTWSWRGC